MEKVEVLESGMVVPSVETPKHRIRLSDLDLLVTQSHAPTVYFYRPTGDPDFFSPAALKTALSKALAPFYPLAGRLGVDEDGRVEINCNGEGALFVVARTGCSPDDFGGFTPSEEMRQMLVPSVERGIPSSILGMFQVTFFKCGGVCLGVAVHHILADGRASLNFINAWSDIARGVQPSTLPFLDRSLLRARSPPTVLFDHVEYSRRPVAEPSTGKAPFVSAILKLSKDQLNSLKRNIGQKGLSTFKVVVAHVWRCACRARQLEGDQETRLYIPADARSRLRPPLPPGYLGNAIVLASAVATAREVLSNSLEFGAEKIDSAIARLDDEYIRSLLDFMALQKDLRGMAKGAWTLPATDLWFVSWQGLPIYDADFGWGRPAFMGRANLQFSGLVYIMHNPPGEDGGLSLAVSLEPENMPRFKKILYGDIDRV